MLSRRVFLGRTGMVAASIPFMHVFSSAAYRRQNSEHHLIRDSRGVIDLPPDFKYRVIDQAGDRMTGGGRVPENPDGMGLFVSPEGHWILMRNHEIEIERGGGGVTRLVLDPNNLSILDSRQVLRGTDRNCNGGLSPWGWFSCEESDLRKHGFVFLCPSDQEHMHDVKKIPGYGKFCHEAVYFDPQSYKAYMTEDEKDSCFYRFVPKNKNNPFNGKLQALRVVNEPNFKTSHMDVGEILETEWVDIEDPLAENSETRDQGNEEGCATFKNGEGMASYQGKMYFSATKGGPNKTGQIFSFSENSQGRGNLTLVATSTDEDKLDCPDALTCAPWGDLFVAEDGKGEQFVRIVKPNGHIKTFAKNAVSSGEFAGLVFSPDGKVLFLNFMEEGLTIAVTGPFQSF